MMKVTVVALEQSIPSGILIIHDMLKTASFSNSITGSSKKGTLFDVRIATADGKPVKYSEFLEIKPHSAVTDIENTDLVIVPSGGYRISGLRNFPSVLTSWMRNMRKKGTCVAGICTGVFLLAESGILEGRTATTHWAYADLFRMWYPEILLEPGRIITGEDGIYSSGGGSAGVDLMLYLMEKFVGPEPVRYCMRMLLLDRGRKEQSPYSEQRFRKDHSDTEILKAQRFIEKRLRENILMDDVAGHVNMSLRNFKRRFKSATGDPPLVYLQKLRMETAKQILEWDDSRIDSVAGMVGYEDVGFFRKLFSRHTGVNPSDYRQKFRQTGV